MTASVYPHATQLRLFAVSPSNTLDALNSFSLSLSALKFSDPRRGRYPEDDPGEGEAEGEEAAEEVNTNAPSPLSLCASASTACASLLIHSDNNWNSSCASWCSRDANSFERLPPPAGPDTGWESALMMGTGRNADRDDFGVLSAIDR
ncbi:hypothetical protein ACEPAH_5395 [Sanghuangporus vaninii]